MQLEHATLVVSYPFHFSPVVYIPVHKHLNDFEFYPTLRREEKIVLRSFWKLLSRIYLSFTSNEKRKVWNAIIKSLFVFFMYDGMCGVTLR